VSIYQVGLLVQVCINILLGMSVYVALSTRQLNLGAAGFMAVGAYTAAMASIAGIPISVSLLLGMLGAMVVGLLIGLPALRVSGIYLAMATFAFGLVMESVFLVLPFAGQARGLAGIPPIEPIVLFVWTAVVLSGVFLLTRTQFWFRVRSIHDDEFAASMTGLNVTTVKIAMFGLSGALAGLAGGMYAHWFVYVEPSAFSVEVSIFAALYVIFGGRQSFWGPVVGATILTLLPEFARGLDSWRPAFIGVALLVILILRPSGLIGRGTSLLTLLVRRVGRTS
jgi:branched-chain amino acid transport system permease protein